MSRAHPQQMKTSGVVSDSTGTDSIVHDVRVLDTTGGVLKSLSTMATAGFVRLTNGTLEALLKAANAAVSTASVVLGVQHIGQDGQATPSGADVAGSIFSRLTNGTVEALLQSANTAVSVASVVLGVQHVGQDGQATPSGADVSGSIFSRLTNGTVEALLQAANTAVSTASVVLGVQHIGQDGQATPSGADVSGSIFSRLTNGTVEALLQTANTAVSTASVVLGVQHIGPDGKSMPSGSDSSGGVYSKLTDGTDDLDLIAADAGVTTSTVVAPTQLVGSDGNSTPSGADAASGIFTRLVDGTDEVAIKDADSAPTTSTHVIVTQNVSEDGNAMPSGYDVSAPIYIAPASAITTHVDGDHIYKSGRDFTAAYSSATEISLTGLPFSPDTDEFLGVLVFPTSGIAYELTPLTNEFSYASATGSTGTLTITDGGFNATDTYRVVVSGPGKAYSQPTDTDDVRITNPKWTQDEYSEIADITSGTDGTYDYYVDMEGFRNFSLYCGLDNGSGTVTMTVEYTNQDDGTAQDSCSYVDVGTSEFGQASWTGVDGTFLLTADNPVIIKYLHIKIVAASGADDGDWFLGILKAVN